MNEETQVLEENNIEQENPVQEIDLSVEQPDPAIQDDFDTSLFSNMTFNRKFRRSLLKQSGYIKLKNRLGYKDWFENIKNNIQNGKQLHASNTEEVIKNIRKSMDLRNESIAAHLLEKGYSEEKVSEIMERNMEVQEKIESKKLSK